MSQMLARANDSTKGFVFVRTENSRAWNHRPCQIPMSRGNLLERELNN